MSYDCGSPAPQSVRCSQRRSTKPDPSPNEQKAARVAESHRCDPKRTALLVIDMQRAFLEEGAALEVPEGRAIVPAIARLVETCRSVDVPVIFTQYVYSPAIPCLLSLIHI